MPTAADCSSPSDAMKSSKRSESILSMALSTLSESSLSRFSCASDVAAYAMPSEAQNSTINSKIAQINTHITKIRDFFRRRKSRLQSVGASPVFIPDSKARL